MYFQIYLSTFACLQSTLLNEARKNTEAIIGALHIPGSQKPRTYRKRAHKDYLKLVRCRKPGTKKIRKCVGQQLRYLRCNLNTIEEMKAAHPDMLSEKQQARLETAHNIRLSGSALGRPR